MRVERLHTLNKELVTTTHLCLATILFFSLASPAYAAKEKASDELLDLSLAELTNINVTSVSKKAEKETEAAAAIFVITQEDIKRSGATAIPEVLRMAPGITVTQSGSHDWTVTARGFNDQFSNKLLVLMDGRTIYSPLFSGVIWDVQDTTLADIDRIEIIRGPGATLWGANAVNGVINIITKSAKDTQGGYASATAGNKVTGIGDVRYGAKIGSNSYARTYAKFSDYDSQYTASGDSRGDAWQRRQGGFRADSKVSDTSNLTVQGDIYRVDINTQYLYPDLTSMTGAASSDQAVAHGGNFLARWTETLSKDSEITLQAYYDNAYRETLFFNDNADTFDLDFQHSWSGWSRQEIVWGAGYRYINDENDPASQQYSLVPSERGDSLFNAFVQDKITLNPNDLFLTIGSKFEHNDYTGVEIQPSVRMSWLPSENQTVWGSVSRAVHTPSRATDDSNLYLGILPPGYPPLFAGVPTLVAQAGNRNLDSEEMIAYELGYRIQPTKTLSLDAALFYNDYQELFAATLGTPVSAGGGTYLYWPVTAENTNEATSMGGELSAKWNVSRQWQLAGAYSYINLRFDDKSNNGGFVFVGKNPRNLFNARSTYIFDNKLEMTNALYYTSPLEILGIDGYYRFDTRLAYPVMEGVEVSLVGQNLFRNQHKEFTPFFYQSQAEIGRSVYGSVAVKF